MLKRLPYISLLLFLYPATALPDSLVLGFNTQTSLQTYSLSGTYQQDFGPTGASAGIEDGGLMYVVQPDISGSTSTVTAFDATQRMISTFTMSDLIGDGAPGANGSLWLAGYDGTVYNVSSAGQVLSSFSTGYTNIGIASNGSSLYTTEGDSGDGIDVRDITGSVLSTVHTGISSLYGLGYDAADSDLFAGSFNYVYQFDTSGALLSTLNLPGDGRTPNGSVHDGLEAFDLTQLITVPPNTSTPEPNTFFLTLLLLLPAVLYAFRRKLRSLLALCAFGSLLPSAFGSVTVKLSALPTTVPVGTRVALSTTASDSSSAAATFTYQYTVQAPGASSFALLKDFYSTNTFSWAPTAHEGSYNIEVTVKSSTGATGSAQLPVSVTSRVTGSTPVVTATQNPLVALYSAPPCPSGSQVRVRFKTASATSWQATPYQACDGFSLNFLVAGMTASTTYTMQQDQYRGPFDTPGPALSFTTGAIPSGITFPSRSTLTGPVAPTSTSFPFILQTPSFYPFATDLSGNIVWYLAAFSHANPNEQGGLFRNTSAGTFLGVQDDPADHCPGSSNYCSDHQFIREWDLAGNIVRETTLTVLNQKVNAMRAAAGQPAVYLSDPSHDSTRLPNGYTALIIADQEVADQGQGPVLVDGDCVLVLDQNFSPVWFWDSFDHLDIKRKALMNETCAFGQSGCASPRRINASTGAYYSSANDWTHCNSITIDTRDNNLVLSSRHQAWVWKLSYTNGTGDGHIIWTLGNQGSFSLPSGTPSTAWFNYQHDVQFQYNSVLTLFDNNNLQNVSNGANSRGQGWTLDETKLIATPTINVDLGAFSAAVGYASELSNGNYNFGAGFLNGGTKAQTYEYNTQGTLVFTQTAATFSYRPIRLPDFYTER